MPPAFVEGLDDWSRGDGTPETPSYEDALNASIALGDADFGACLELVKTDPVQHLRYMGEVPMPAGAVLEVSARLKAVTDPLPQVRLVAWPGGLGGRRVPELDEAGPIRALRRRDTLYSLRIWIGRATRPDLDLIWDERVLYAHVGLDLLGESGGRVRIEAIGVRALGPDAGRGGDRPRPLAAAPAWAAG